MGRARGLRGFNRFSEKEKGIEVFSRTSIGASLPPLFTFDASLFIYSQVSN